jgi:hypothetical protein
VRWVLHLEKEAGEAADLANIPRPVLSEVQRHLLYEKCQAIYKKTAEVILSAVPRVAAKGDVYCALELEKESVELADLANISRPTLSTAEWQEIHRMVAERKIAEARRCAAKGNLYWALDAENEAGEFADLAEIPRPLLSTAEWQAMYKNRAYVWVSRAQGGETYSLKDGPEV